MLLGRSYFFCSLALLVFLSSTLSAQCIATAPPSTPFVPPTPYPSNSVLGWFWYGTDELWTKLPPGDWAGGYWAAVGSPQKLFVWSQHFDWRTAQYPYLK